MNPLLKITFISLSFVLFFISCKNKGQKKISLFENGYKEINIEKFKYLPDIRFQKIDNSKLISYFNRKDYSIVIYSYDSNKLIKKIKLEKDGESAIKTPFYWFDYYIQNLDTIFISTVKNYYLIDSTGKVLKRITPKINKNYFKIKRPIFNETTSYSKGYLSFQINQLLPNDKDTVYIRRSYNFISNKIKEDFIDIKYVLSNYDTILKNKRALFKKGGFDKIPIHMVKYQNDLIASTPISDSIFIYRNTNVIERYYVGDSVINISNYQGYFNRKEIIKIGSNSAISNKLNQPAYFTNMLCDDKYIYRILSHGTKENRTFHPEYIDIINNESKTKSLGATLCVFDMETKQSYNFTLPTDEIEIPLNNTNIFVTNEGVHFPLKSNNSLSQIRYKIFKIK